MTPAPTTQVVVGRQGIYDAVGSVVGYELLFRGVAGSSASVTGDQMTAEVLFSAVALGFDHLVSDRDAFCNADRGVLIGDIPLNLPPERTVVEVLETVRLDRDVLDGCRMLAQEGYRLALDDFVWRPGSEELLPLASIVKIDMLETGGRELTELIERCRNYDVQLLAEKVEDPDQLGELRGLGFDLFQGYALERPALIAGRSMEPGVVARLRMAAALLTGDPEMDEVEEIVRTDPVLALQLIQVASVGRPGETRRQISSLRQALVLMGSRRVRNWAALLLSRSRTRTSVGHDFISTLILARACELLVTQVDAYRGHVGFAAGMLSAMPEELQVSPEDLCQTVSLSQELVDAAFRAEGPIGRIVRDAREFHHGSARMIRRSQLSTEDLHTAFAKAVAWAVACSAALDTTATSGAA
jgi:EAL and modified HD-GYP domain-containing signal transduction protein